jgi:hypothetical protein
MPVFINNAFSDEVNSGIRPHFSSARVIRRHRSVMKIEKKMIPNPLSTFIRERSYSFFQKRYPMSATM